jgi:HK97 family phage prohead protease
VGQALRTEAEFTAGNPGDVKAVESEGDLVIEGYAARFTPDEQNEAFEPEAFNEAVVEAQERGLPLLYHHKGSMQLGNVEYLEPRPDGLWMRARVPEPKNTELHDIYTMMKRGMTRGLSVAGKFFRRSNEKAADGYTEAQTKIWKARLREISVTPLSVHPDTMFDLATAGQKAFADPEPEATETPDLQGILEVWRRFEDGVERIERKLG